MRRNIPWKAARPGVILIWLAGVSVMGCQPATPSARKQIRPPRLAEQPAEELDFGDDWASVEGLLGGGGGRQRPGQPGVERPAMVSDRASRPPRAPRFGICLATFTDPDHRRSSQLYAQRIGMLVPDMADGLSLHSDDAGSMVLFGDYSGWQDPSVAETTKRLRLVQVEGRPLFLNPILTEVTVPRDPSDIGPLELLSLRVQFPEIRTLYTLEVAVWGDFGGGELADDERRRLAEDYARLLRGQGHQAWYHHDESKRMSTVTVGAFDHTAIDAASGIRSAAVERVLAGFRARLVNGEVLMIPVSRNNPAAGMKPQQPFLVEVPQR